jgi:predicted ATPase
LPRLKTVKLLRDSVTRWDQYPFNVPPIASLETIEITSRVCFFVGENGTGKSTLLEAIAAHYGFGREDGNRNFSLETTTSVRSIDPPVRAWRVAFTVRTGSGFYFRAESFFQCGQLC